MKKTAYPIITTDELLASAVAAFRINSGEYIKRSNALLTSSLLQNFSGITEDDRRVVDEVKTLVQNTLAIKVLKGFDLNDFEKQLIVVTGDKPIECSPLHTSIAAYVPQYYELETAKQSIETRLFSAERDYLGDPDSKITATMEIVKINYSQKYGCSFITALTDDNKRVFFAYSGKVIIEVNQKYDVKATVKRHDSDWITVLGRVKPTKI